MIPTIDQLADNPTFANDMLLQLGHDEQRIGVLLERLDGVLDANLHLGVQESVPTVLLQKCHQRSEKFRLTNSAIDQIL